MKDDLTPQEQRRVRAAMRYLKVSYDGWERLAAALGNCYRQVYRTGTGLTHVTAGMAARVARLAEVSLGDVLDGRFPPLGTCPHCGRRVDEFPDEDTRVVETVVEE